MSKYRTIVALVIGLVGVLAITTQAIAMTWGQLKCRYADKNVEACFPVPKTDTGEDKNSG